MPKTDPYTIVAHACCHLIESRCTKTKSPTRDDRQAFTLLWQAQSAMVKGCGIYDQPAIEFNLQISGHAMRRGGKEICQ